MNCLWIRDRRLFQVMLTITLLTTGAAGCSEGDGTIPPPPAPGHEIWDIRFIWDEAGDKYIHSTAEVTFDDASVTIETDSVWSTYDDYPWDSFRATIWGGIYNDTLFLVEGRKYTWIQGEELDSAVFVYCHDVHQPLALQYNQENGTFSLECVEMVSKKTGVDGPYKIEGLRH